MKWYKLAAEGGDRRATKRLASNNRDGLSALDRRVELEALKEEQLGKGGKEGCTVM
jgi:hypothetical protein